MKKTSKRWVSFDFGSENTVSGDTAAPSKKKAAKSRSCGILDIPVQHTRTFDFHTALTPKNLSDVAVHPKKLKELEEWLEENVESKDKKQAVPEPSFLLLTGPTGCGKTIALKVLCNKLGISLSEWVNPLDQDGEFRFRSNQIERFLEFLTESTKWTSLFEGDNLKKITLVEDFPNAVIHHPEDFFNILEECSYRTRCPIVFICTDSVIRNGIQLSRTLFPQEIRDKYNISNISFNACADTIMKNALRRAHNLAEANTDLFRLPSISTINAIIASSMGDIRCAMNQFCLASLMGSRDLPTVPSPGEKSGSKKRRNATISKVASMNRDETLGLFHGLGRVLNPKRKEHGNSWRLNCDIEKLIDEFSTQPSSFTAFLFENYIKYFGDFNELSAAADTLSLSQLFLDKWNDRNDTMIFALWISVLGIMIANEHRLSRWTPIQGPKKIEVTLNNDLRRQGLSQTDYYYCNIINKKATPNRFTLKKIV